MNLAIPKNWRELKQHLNDPLFKNSYFIMLDSISTSIFGFIFWMIVARHYIPTNVGLAIAILSMSQLIIGFSGLGLGSGLIRFLPKEGDKKNMINFCFLMTGISSIILTAVFIMGLNYWSPKLLFIREDSLFLFSFIVLSIIFSILVLQSNIFIAFRVAKFSFFQGLIYNIIRTLLPIGLISFGLFGIVSSWTIATIISFMVSILFFIPMVQPKYKSRITIKKRTISKIIPFSFGNYIAGILGSLPAKVMPIMILNCLGAEMAAYFYMAHSVGIILSVISGAVTISLFAEGSHDRERFRSNVIKSIKFIFLLLIPTIFALFLFGNKVLLLFGKTYSEHATVLLWLFGISNIPSAINKLYITIKKVQIDIKKIIYINAFIAFVIISGSYISMNKIGLIGIGSAWILGQGLVALVVGLPGVKKEI